MKRIFAIMMALILMLSMTTASVFAETEPASESSAATENAESSGEDIDYSLYPLVTENQAVELIAKAIKDHKNNLRFRIDGYSDVKNGFDYAKELLYKAYGDIPEYYETENYVSAFCDDSKFWRVVLNMTSLTTSVKSNVLLLKKS